MRTTLDLPDALLRSAKIEAVRRGTSLRELVARAVERELTDPSTPSPTARRAHFPVFTATSRDGHPVTSDDVRRDELDEDLRLAGDAL